MIVIQNNAHAEKNEYATAAGVLEKENTNGIVVVKNATINLFRFI